MSPLKGVVVPSGRPRRKASTAWGYTDLATGSDSQPSGAPSVRILDDAERLLSEIYCSRLMAPVQPQRRPRAVPEEGGDQQQGEEREEGAEEGQASQQRQQEDEEEQQQARRMTLLQALLLQVSQLVAGKPAAALVY